MKKFNFIIVFIFFVNVLFPQNQYQHAVEIFVGTEGVVPQSKNITFYLTKCGPVFGDKINGVKYYYVTQKYDLSNYIPLTNNNPSYNWAGWCRWDKGNLYLDIKYSDNLFLGCDEPFLDRHKI